MSGKKNKSKDVAQVGTIVSKQVEFEEFLKLIDEETLPDTWELVAEEIGVHKNTLTSWRKTPEFKVAKARGIKRALQRMERAGNYDWRMWREKYSLLTKEKKEDTNTTNILVIPSELMSKYGISSNTEDSSSR